MKGYFMKKRIALILALSLILTSLSMPATEIYAGQEEADRILWNDEVKTTGTEEIPTEYLTFDSEKEKNNEIQSEQVEETKIEESSIPVIGEKMKKSEQKETAEAEVTQEPVVETMPVLVSKEKGQSADGSNMYQELDANGIVSGNTTDASVSVNEVISGSLSESSAFAYYYFEPEEDGEYFLQAVYPDSVSLSIMEEVEDGLYQYLSDTKNIYNGYGSEWQQGYGVSMCAGGKYQIGFGGQGASGDYSFQITKAVDLKAGGTVQIDDAAGYEKVASDTVVLYTILLTGEGADTYKLVVDGQQVGADLDGKYQFFITPSTHTIFIYTEGIGKNTGSVTASIEKSIVPEVILGAEERSVKQDIVPICDSARREMKAYASYTPDQEGNYVLYAENEQCYSMDLCLYTIDEDGAWKQIEYTASESKYMLYHLMKGVTYYIQINDTYYKNYVLSNVALTLLRVDLTKLNVGQQLEINGYGAEVAVLTMGTCPAGFYRMAIESNNDGNNDRYEVYGIEKNHIYVYGDRGYTEPFVISGDLENQFIFIESNYEEMQNITIKLQPEEIAAVTLGDGISYQMSHDKEKECTVWSFIPSETAYYTLSCEGYGDGNISLYKQTEEGIVSVEGSYKETAKGTEFFGIKMDSGTTYYWVYRNVCINSKMILEKTDYTKVTDQETSAKLYKTSTFLYEVPAGGFYELNLTGQDGQYTVLASLEDTTEQKEFVVKKGNSKIVCFSQAGMYHLTVIKDAVSKKKDTISLKVSSNATVKELKENTVITEEKTDLDGIWVSFVPKSSGYYFLNMGMNEIIERLSSNRFVLSEDAMEMTSLGNLNEVYVKQPVEEEDSFWTRDIGYEAYYEAGRQYYVHIFSEYNSRYQELSMELLPVKTMSLADQNSFELSSGFVHLVTDYTKDTLFDLESKGYVAIADASISEDDNRSWKSIDDAFMIEAGKKEYLLFNAGEDIIAQRRDVNVTTEEQTITAALYKGNNWIKYTPETSGYYSLYMPYQKGIKVEAYEEEDKFITGIEADGWATVNSCIYTVKMQAGKNYYYKLISNEDLTIPITGYRVTNVGGLKEGTIKICVDKNVLLENMLLQGYYSIKVLGTDKVYLRWICGDRIMQTEEVTSDGSFIAIDRRSESDFCPKVELIKDTASDENKLTLEIEKLKSEDVIMALQQTHIQKTDGKIQSYCFTAEETGNYVVKVKCSKQWNKKLVNNCGFCEEKKLSDGMYQYKLRGDDSNHTIQVNKGETIFITVVNNNEYQITVEPVSESLIMDYDRYMAFIASGGTIQLNSNENWAEDDLETHGYLHTANKIYYNDASRFKDKNQIWLLSNDGQRVGWLDTWHGEYGHYYDLYESGQVKISDYINSLNADDKFYTVTDIYTVSDQDTTKVKQKNNTDYLDDNDNIILLKSVPRTVYVQKIQLSGTTALVKGQTASITATIDTMNQYQASNPNVTFSSSDPTIVKISANGEMQGVSVGTAEIICKSADGNAEQKMTVTVADSVEKSDTEPTQIPQPDPAPTKEPDVLPSVQPSPEPEKKGTTIQAEKGTGKYKVTDANGESPSVEYAGQTKAEKKKKTVTIPATVTSNGVKYEVTSVAPKSFKNNKKVTTVKMPATIEKIGSSAFEGCKKLKTVAIGKSTKSIGKNAFKNCKDLKTVTIKSTKVPKIDKSAFKGVNKKCVIKVPKKLVKKYKQLFKKKGIKLKVKAI